VAGPSARRARTSLRLRALDARDRLSGRSGRLVPPRRLQFVGEGDFVGIGDEFLSHLVSLCGLRPEDRVLDVGCGVGRLARPLAGYLSLDGAYAGFDVSAAGIRWCTQHYLGQTRRVLARGGRVLPTAFVLDPRAPDPSLSFGAARDGMAVVDPALPEEAVAYEEEWLLEALRAAGLDLVALHPGSWTGRTEGLSFQDVVVVRA
jgi:SAM-dependent methyltransferase